MYVHFPKNLLHMGMGISAKLLFCLRLKLNHEYWQIQVGGSKGALDPVLQNLEYYR